MSFLCWQPVEWLSIPTVGREGYALHFVPSLLSDFGPFEAFGPRGLHASLVSFLFMRERLFGFMGLPRVDPISTGATFARPTRRVTICPRPSYRLGRAVAPARAAGGRPAGHGERVPTGFPVVARPTPARTHSPFWRSWCPGRQSARPASPGAWNGGGSGRA